MMTGSDLAKGLAHEFALRFAILFGAVGALIGLAFMLGRMSVRWF